MGTPEAELVRRLSEDFGPLPGVGFTSPHGHPPHPVSGSSLSAGKTHCFLEGTVHPRQRVRGRRQNCCPLCCLLANVHVSGPHSTLELEGEWLSLTQQDGRAGWAVLRREAGAGGLLFPRSQPPSTGTKPIPPSPTGQHFQPNGLGALPSPSGPSKEADGTRAPRMRTAFTAEQVSALESSFQHRRYLGPLERRRLAQEMQLSEVQVRWPAGRVVACGRPLSDLTLPTGKDLVSEPPNEAQAPAAGLPAESALLRTPPPAPRPAQPPAAALPLGLPAWAPSSGPASGLFLGSPWSETSLPGFSVGLMQQAASGVLPPVCCLPDTGGWVHTLSPALSRGAWGLCAPPATGDAF